MTRDKEAQLFDYLCRHKPFKEWLAVQMARQVEILLVNPDHGALQRAQGAAGFIKLMTEKLTAAESVANRQ
jgi:phosphoribosylpyrophosphate synthetase